MSTTLHSPRRPDRRCLPRLRRTTLALGIVAGCGASFAAAAVPAQTVLDARQAYDTVQQMRNVAERMWNQGDRSALDSLQHVLRFLERPDVRDLAQGWPYLYSRTSNVWYDLAHYHAEAGDTAAALEALEQLVRTGGSSGYLSILSRDTSLAKLSELPRFQRAVRALAVERRMWADSAFITPYEPELSLDRRIAGLAQLWAEVRWAYPDFKRRPEFDWDSLFIAYLPKVRATERTYDYYRVLQEFMAQLRDGHSNVYFASEVYDSMATPPIRTELIEDRVIVRDVMSPTVAGLGVRVGQEVVAIDGIPVEQYAAERVAPYQSSSTPQDLAVRTYSYALLWGPGDEPVRLTLGEADGARREVDLPRSGYEDRVRRPSVSDSLLPGNIGYLRVDDFGRDTIVQQMREAMERFRSARALVIDVRRNGGGNSNIGYALLRILARRSFPGSVARVRSYSAYYRVRGFEPLITVLPAGTIAPDTTLHYDGPVVVLAGAMTFSAAEDFLVAYRQMERGPIFGEPTGGSTGQPLFFRLPGGGSARVRTKHDSFADGREFDAIGVQPDALVLPTVEGLRAGRDEVLEAALRHLREETSGR